MLGMGSYNMYEFALTTICLYELFSYKLNFEIIKKHNSSIIIINERLDTGVASMYNNPLNIIILDDIMDDNLDDSNLLLS
jgi:hypothetical protein